MIAAYLYIIPSPDSIIEVIMIWKFSANPVENNGQGLPSYQRKGSAVIEWGGIESID